MKQRDGNNSFIFHDMEWTDDILSTSDLGLWSMVTDQQMSEVKFYIDSTMAKLLGLKEQLAPELCFEFWYKRINRGNYTYVNETMRRMIETGKLCEVQYTWNHPEWGDIPVRCAGKAREMEDGVLLITGYHQNISILDQMKRWSLNVSWEEVFEYNLNTGTALIYTDRKLTYGTDQQIKDFPRQWMKEAVIHPESCEAFLNAFKALEAGERQTRCEVRLKNQHGEYQWFAMELEIMAYENNVPEIALGRLIDISRQKEIENAYIREVRMKQLVLEDALAYGEVDLTEDKVRRLSGRWKPSQGYAEDNGYNSLARELAEQSVKPEDREIHERTFSRENLLNQFSRGSHKVSLQYRRLMGNDKLRWVQNDTYLFTDPEEGHVFGFYILRDIDEYKNMEYKLAGGHEEETVRLGKEFDRFLSAAGDACCLIDPCTYELITANQSFYRDMMKPEEECRGKKCYELIYNHSEPCTFCNRIHWEKDKFSLWENTDPALNVKRLMKTKLVDWHGREAVLAIGIDTHKADEDQGICVQADGQQRVTDQVLSGICAMMEASSLEESMKRVMDMLADYYGPGHIQVYLQRKGSFECKCIARWDEPGQPAISSQTERHMEQWLCARHPSGIMNISESQDMIAESFELYKDMEREHASDMSLYPVVYKGDSLGYIAIFDSRNRLPMEVMDILIYFTGQEVNKRQDAEQLYYSIYHDSLTGLLNRGSYDEYRREYSPDNVSSLGIMVIDINDLKSVNDTRGTEAGDSLIRRTAAIIKKTFSDVRIFRLNSNEFDIVAVNMPQQEFDKRVGQLLRHMNDAPGFSVSSGRIWDDREKNLDWAMKQAGELMHIDKQKYYENVPSQTGRGRAEMIKQLTLSIERGEFKVVFQPKLFLQSGKCAGAEALIRYCDPKKGVIMPSRFIGILERENLISYVDLFVMEECCRQLEQWKKRGINGLVLSFNFSRMTLLGADIVESVQSIVKKYDVEPGELEIEVTESIGELGRDVVYKAIGDFKRLGYRISLDDFGTKYSNLDILSDVDFDVLKLDKSLVDKIGMDEVSGQIVKHVIAMCHDMDIQTVAEGMEESRQVDSLKGWDCAIGQGYYYGKPMDVESFEKRFLE